MGAIAAKELRRRGVGLRGDRGGRRKVGRAGVLVFGRRLEGRGRSGGVVGGRRLGAIAAKEKGRKGVGSRGDRGGKGEARACGGFGG